MGLSLRRVIVATVKVYGIIGVMIGIGMLIYSFQDSDFTFYFGDSKVYGYTAGIIAVFFVPLVMGIVGIGHAVFFYFPLAYVYRKLTRKKVIGRNPDVSSANSTGESDMWKPYEIVRQHPHDFRVKYRFYRQDEGGRKHLPHQGYRSDFAYDGDDIKEIFVIHPEFEDEQGNIITDRSVSVNINGTARMWILISEMRETVHQHRITVGTKGYFMEGPRRVGEVEVIEIAGLHANK